MDPGLRKWADETIRERLEAVEKELPGLLRDIEITWSPRKGRKPMFRRSKRPTTHRIEIYLENLDQLFNSMDPSPFHEKDLDEDAEEFILSWAEEYPVHDPIVLVVHLRRYPTDTDPQQVVERAVHNHFAYKARLNRLQFRRLLREGRISL